MIVNLKNPEFSGKTFDIHQINKDLQNKLRRNYANSVANSHKLLEISDEMINSRISIKDLERKSTIY